MNLLILGMHRSGTSVLGRIVTRLGFYPGPEGKLMPPLEENPTGFWERRDIRDINDKILKLNESSWDCPTKSFPTRRELPKEISHDIATILSRMESQYPYFVKDPRISLTGNYWFSKYTKFFPILAIRNPVEVAHSLRKRNSLPLELGLALWEKYTISALRLLGRKRYFIYDYNSFISNPRNTLNELINEFKNLNIQLNPVSLNELGGLVDVKLKRNNYKKNDSGPYKYYTDLYQNIVSRKPIKASSRTISVPSANVIDLYKVVKKIDLEIDLKQSLDKSNDELLSIKSKYEALNSERNILVQNVADLTKQNNVLLEKFNFSEKSRSNLEEVSRELQKRLEVLLSEKNELAGRYEDLSGKAASFEEENKRLFEESSNHILRFDQKAKENQQLESRNNELAHSLENASIEREKLKTQKEELAQSLEKSVQRNVQKQERCAQLNKKLNTEAKRYRELEKQNLRYSEELRERISDLKQQSNKVDNLNAEIQKLTDDLTKLNKIIDVKVQTLNNLKSDNKNLCKLNLKSERNLLDLRLRLHTLKLLNDQLNKIDSYHRSSIKAYSIENESRRNEIIQLREYIKDISEKNIQQGNEIRRLQNQILYNQIKTRIHGTKLNDPNIFDSPLNLSECDTLKKELLSLFTKSYDDFNTLKLFIDSMVTSFLEAHLIASKLNNKISDLNTEKDSLNKSLNQFELKAKELSQKYLFQTDRVRSLEKQLNVAIEQAKLEHTKVKAMQEKFHNGKIIHLYYFGKNIFRSGKK